MNAGKTTLLLQHKYKNDEKNFETIILIPYTANTDGLIISRIGITKQAIILLKHTNIFKYIKNLKKKPKHILIDEVQFLEKKQIYEIICIVDILHISVFTYGLRTDFKSQLFNATKYLFSFADKIVEIKTICNCGKKAIMNAKFNNNKKIVHGNQIDINKKSYIPLCRYHYYNTTKLNFK